MQSNRRNYPALIISNWTLTQMQRLFIYEWVVTLPGNAYRSGDGLFRIWSTNYACRKRRLIDEESDLNAERLHIDKLTPSRRVVISPSPRLRASA